MNLLSRLLLIRPARVAENLERVQRADLVDKTPNVWQVTQGVLRMWHRIMFRSETIGTCTAHSVRDTWRARLLAYRPIRFPFLLAERAVAPWDLSGLLSSPERLICHLLGAHHDEQQFVYDLEILRCHPGSLERVRELAKQVVDNDDARSRWLRDLVVYDRYHENLLAAVDHVLSGGEVPDAYRDDPDVTFVGYLRWCARQPETPAATWSAWRPEAA
jgi:hypothetical protein